MLFELFKVLTKQLSFNIAFTGMIKNIYLLMTSLQEIVDLRRYFATYPFLKSHSFTFLRN